MSNAEYGATNNHTQQDEESPLISSRGVEHTESCRQKFQRITHKHRFRIIAGWTLVLAVTALATVGIHYALKDHSEPVESPENPDALVGEMCVSERSWFVALMLSIFLGPLGNIFI
jgi:hypothetical protein